MSKRDGTTPGCPGRTPRENTAVAIRPGQVAATCDLCGRDLLVLTSRGRLPAHKPPGSGQRTTITFPREEVGALRRLVDAYIRTETTDPDLPLLRRALDRLTSKDVIPEADAPDREERIRRTADLPLEETTVE
ncbi:hypothetical protein [Nonomuraea sp. NPDC003214]